MLSLVGLDCYSMHCCKFSQQVIGKQGSLAWRNPSISLQVLPTPGKPAKKKSPGNIKTRRLLRMLSASRWPVECQGGDKTCPKTRSATSCLCSFGVTICREETGTTISSVMLKKTCPGVSDAAFGNVGPRGPCKMSQQPTG